MLQHPSRPGDIGFAMHFDPPVIVMVLREGPLTCDAPTRWCSMYSSDLIENDALLYLHQLKAYDLIGLG